jgi:hypothetical protein
VHQLLASSRHANVRGVGAECGSEYEGRDGLLLGVRNSRSGHEGLQGVLWGCGRGLWTYLSGQGLAGRGAQELVQEELNPMNSFPIYVSMYTLNNYEMYIVKQ